jgi:hypothetical protein
MADFDFSKLKDNMGGLVDNLKSMINPAGGTPQVDPDDALGVKIAQMSTLIKQLVDAEQEQLKQLKQLNELLNGAFQDMEALRQSIKAKKAEKTPE